MAIVKQIKVKMSTSRGELDYIANKLGTSVEQVDELRTYNGIILDENSALLKSIHKGIDGVYADAMKAIAKSGLNDELKKHMTESCKISCATAKSIALDVTAQNEAVVAYRNIPRMPSETAPAVKRDVTAVEL